MSHILERFTDATPERPDAQLDDLLPAPLYSRDAKDWYEAAHNCRKEDFIEFSMADCCSPAHLRLRRSALLLKLTGLLLIFGCRSYMPEVVIIVIVVAALMEEFWSLQDILSAWIWVHRRCYLDEYKSLPALLLKEWRGCNRIKSLSRRWSLWVFPLMLGSFAKHAAFLATCTGINQVLNGNYKQLRFPYFGLCILYSWIIGNNLGVIHALFSHTPSGERIGHGPDNRKTPEGFDAWKPKFDRDRTVGRKLKASRQEVEVTRLEIRFCVLASWIGRKLETYVLDSWVGREFGILWLAYWLRDHWEGTHYESVLAWSRAQGAFSIMATFPSSFHTDMALFKESEAWSHYIRRATAIMKLGRFYAWLTVLPDSCLLLLYQSACVLGTPVEDSTTKLTIIAGSIQISTTKLTIIAGLFPLLFCDSQCFWKVWCIYLETCETAVRYPDECKKHIRFIKTAMWTMLVPSLVVMLLAALVAIAFTVRYW